MLYTLNAQYMNMVRPWHHIANYTRQVTSYPWNPFAHTLMFRSLHAGLELFERVTDYYEEPAWDLDFTEIDEKPVPIDYQIVQARPFCHLLHFRRMKRLDPQPKVLMVAPLSGHYATLLRGTVREFLPDHEVYITDWRNVRDVPVEHGTFTFDDYVEYLMEFMDYLGRDTHVIAVCQPCVPTLVALAVMYMSKDINVPRSVTLMGGPVDVRISPTEVNDYASGKDLEWFEDNVICQVSSGFKGEGQWVYPGFIQLSGFLSMNMDNHVNKHFKLFDDLIIGDKDSAEAHRKFYNEYLAVMDMPADYYLDTIRKVFLEYKLPKGTMEYRGQKIDLGAITDTALMTVEGELDDITGKGQTSTALDLCHKIPQSMRQHYEQPGVGHYGIFNGRRFREEIAPKLKTFIQTYEVKH